MLRGLPQLILAAAIVLLAGPASAQEAAASYHNLVSTNAIAKPDATLQSAPQTIVGTNTMVTGLLVDLAKPKQTWRMMNPTNAVRTVSDVRPTAAVRNAAPFNDNLAVHEPDFAVLSFHFMHSSKPAVSTSRENPAQSADK